MPGRALPVGARRFHCGRRHRRAGGAARDAALLQRRAAQTTGLRHACRSHLPCQQHVLLLDVAHGQRQGLLQAQLPFGPGGEAGLRPGRRGRAGGDRRDHPIGQLHPAGGGDHLADGRDGAGRPQRRTADRRVHRQHLHPAGGGAATAGGEGGGSEVAGGVGFAVALALGGGGAAAVGTAGAGSRGGGGPPAEGRGGRHTAGAPGACRARAEVLRRLSQRLRRRHLDRGPRRHRVARSGSHSGRHVARLQADVLAAIGVGFVVQPKDIGQRAASCVGMLSRPPGVRVGLGRQQMYQ
mmetsp:Transcript_52628/g.150679  ORF Transcript_52628/g.150679 Transcript_52628/m.150679 type:complete len:296 (+) Transcript_52628:193-1080(+)